jgi:hypothetical protein
MFVVGEDSRLVGTNESALYTTDDSPGPSEDLVWVVDANLTRLHSRC